MNYEGIECDIRAGLGRNEWAIVIYFPEPSDPFAPSVVKFQGTREEANSVGGEAGRLRLFRIAQLLCELQRSGSSSKAILRVGNVIDPRRDLCARVATRSGKHPSDLTSRLSLTTRSCSSSGLFIL